MCPKVMCDADLVEIDDLITPVIISLNRKNYITTYCCSGHITGPYNFLGSYIKFTEDSFDKLIKNNPPPKYWCYDVDRVLMCPWVYQEPVGVDILIPGYGNLTDEFMKNYRTKFTEVVKILESLYTWSDNLK
jgi:hypothetical protein